MTLLHDLRYAGRTLLRERTVSAVIVLILTLGIAATAIMVGVVDQLLLQPPPGIGHADAVRRVYFGSDRPQADGAPILPQPNQSYPLMRTLAGSVPGFSAAAATHRADVTLGAGPGARRVAVALVDAAYFPLLELVPAAGRFFTAAEARVPDADPVVVLSHAFWIREFAGEAAVGRDLLVEGRRLTVVGVAPRGFSGTRRQRVDLWAPPGALGRVLFGDDWAATDNVYRFELIARLAPGATDAQANAQATAVYRRSFRTDDAVAFGAPLTGAGNPRGMATVARVGLWLLGVAAVVLLIACANAATLLLARTIARSREMAVRVAIGASRGRLLRQLLTESALLSGIAVAAALLVTYVAARLVQQLLVPGFVWNDGVVNERVLAIALGAAVLTTFVAGLAPALHALSNAVIHTIRPAQRVTRGRLGVLRSGLLVLQVTLCVVLLVGAGLFIRSLAAIRGFDVGVDLHRVIQASLPSTLPGDQRDALYRAAIDRLAGLPGIERVALGGGSTRLRTSSSVSMTPEGMTRAELAGRDMDAYFVVTPGYFATLGSRIEQGRDLTAEDEQLRARVAVVNRTFAERFWPGAGAVGKCLSFSIAFNPKTCTTIAGIVENTLLHSRTDTGSAQVFVLRAHPDFASQRATALMIRTSGDAEPLVPMVRDALQTLTPDMRYVDVATLEAMVAPQLQPWRLGSAMFFIFGAVALLIAAIGLYSTMAFAVSQRTQEIGIRMALGASMWDVVRRIGISGAVTVGAGLTLGLLAAAVATRWLGDLLFQTAPRDPLVFTVVAVVLALAGVMASIVPARRAASVDPLVVLRE